MAMIDLSKVKKVKESEELDPNNTKKSLRSKEPIICLSASLEGLLVDLIQMRANTYGLEMTG